MFHWLRSPATIIVVFITVLLVITGAASARSVESPLSPTDDPERIINDSVDQ